MRKFLVIALVMTSALFSCQKETDNDSLLLDGTELKSETGVTDNAVCLELVYPVSFTMPDRSTLTGNSREEIGAAIKEWFASHPRATKKYVLQYPVDVIFKGKLLTIHNEQEMTRVKKACAEGKDLNKDTAKKICFTMVFPLTYIMPDGMEITRNSREEMDNAFKRWYNANDSDQKPVLKFPVAIKYQTGDARGDFKIVRIRSQEELRKAYAACGK